ncbi:hypothetical protein Tco_0707461 [Tanacetum coccineum]|uniref:Uncharacterized protein n=1 Tax=Tanacetum coccineum TaxID=301880 RepID=A0ABQ4YCE1_9ASTR
MEDEHLDTIPVTESANTIKSSVEDLVPTPSESADLSDGKSECDSLFRLYPHADSESLWWRIDLFLASDDSMPPGIEIDDYDSEGDIRFLEELLSNDSPPLPENESFSLDHFDDPSLPRPPPEPPDVEICFNFEPDAGVVTKKVVGDISEHDVLMPICVAHPTHPLSSVKRIENEAKTVAGTRYEIRTDQLWRINVVVNGGLVLQTVKTDMVKHDVEVESLDECVDEIDKLAELIGEMQLKQEDQKWVKEGGKHGRCSWVLVGGKICFEVTGKEFGGLSLLVPQGNKVDCKLGPCGDIGLRVW